MRLHAVQLRLRRWPRSTAAPSSSPATTSRCGAAPPTPRSPRSAALRRADRHRAAACPTSAWSTAWAAAARSRRSRPGRPHLHARDEGLGHRGRTPERGALGVAGARLGGRDRRRPGADAHYSVIVRGHRADDDRRPRARRVGGARRRVEGGARATPTSTPPTARSTTSSTPRTRRSTAARRFLSYLPVERRRAAAPGRADDDPERREETLLSIVPRDPRRVYKMRAILIARSSTGTRSSRSAGNWGKSIITGLARLDGWPVALFAEDPYIYGGAWTADAARKLTRFIDLASHVPPAPRPPRGLPRLPHRQAVRGGRHRSATARPPSPRWVSRRARSVR